jgi:predicted MPP superfamily phosphohydrolase
MFFTFFLGVIGLLHFYLYRQLEAAWPQATIWFRVVLTVMLFLPFLMILFRSRGYQKLSRIFALAGFTWIGVLFFTDFVFVVLSLWNFISLLVGASPLAPQMTVYVAAAISASAIAYGYLEAGQIRTRKLELPVAKPLRSPHPIRLVQITDLHLGYVANVTRLRRLVDRINDLKPDLIVSTGDLFDSDFEKMDPMVEILADLHAEKGKYAISGNHEVYENLQSGLDLTRRCGFRVLQGESVEVRSDLYVAGVDDAEALEDGVNGQHEKEALEGIPEKACTILLKHRPTVITSSIGRFDLQLSGHTHGGQIFPFSLLTRLVYRYRPGLSRVGPSSWLYLSRGTGTWGPQFRILAPPEITVIDLRGRSIQAGG